jgi:hypothetical protein
MEDNTNNHVPDEVVQALAAKLQEMLGGDVKFTAMLGHDDLPDQDVPPTAAELEYRKQSLELMAGLEVSIKFDGHVWGHIVIALGMMAHLPMSEEHTHGVLMDAVSTINQELGPIAGPRLSALADRLA